MKVMFSAGEASGDTHAANIAKALRAKEPQVEMLGMGGSLMAQEGVKIVYDIKNLGYIGIVEILKALPTFFKLRSFLREVMEKEKPDVLVCVDYPGFNMKLAKVAHELGIPVVYYIAPTIWAWHRSRGKTIAKYVTKVASIFPFEAKAYKEFGCDVTFVGHPLLDIVVPEMTREEACVYFGCKTKDINILLMPGSRKQEIASLLDLMLQSAVKIQENYPHAHFYLPRAHTIDKEFLQTYLDKYNVPVTVTEGKNYDLMQICDICIAASGTATLETALMNLPTILTYRLSPLTYALGKLLVKLDYVGLPNIVGGRQIIPELLQGAVTVDNIYQEVAKLLDNPSYYQKMKEELAQVRSALGKPGAVQRVADVVLKVGAPK